jgi:hypothetical protein
MDQGATSTAAGKAMTHITREPARVYIEHLMCDCGGEMVSTEKYVPPPLFQVVYQCNKCGYRETPQEVYPRLGYESVILTTPEAIKDAIKANDIALGKRLLDIHSDESSDAIER